MIDPMQRSTIIGVHFKPAGAFPFLSAAADELADIWGDEGNFRRLRERLRELAGG